MGNKTLYDRTLIHHKKIVSKSMEHAKLTKKKNTISMICGGSILLASIPAKFINNNLAIGLLTAGILQITVSSLQRVYLEKKK